MARGVTVAGGRPRLLGVRGPGRPASGAGSAAAGAREGCSLQQRSRGRGGARGDSRRDGRCEQIGQQRGAGGRDKQQVRRPASTAVHGLRPARARQNPVPDRAGTARNRLVGSYLVEYLVENVARRAARPSPLVYSYRA